MKQRILMLIIVGCVFSISPIRAFNNPRVNDSAVVKLGQARFTVLTESLIRLEWSRDSIFEDRATFTILNRNLPVPIYQTTVDAGWFTLSTNKLTLKYRVQSGEFDSANLSIRFLLNEKPVVWTPGMIDTGNLGGTIRTLDGVRGAAKLDDGLLSRSGWKIIDDSRRPLFDASDRPWVVSQSDTTKIDWYFLGYGHEYKKLLGDFVKIAGEIPIPPRFAFGVWWSRYWPYSDQELKKLVTDFESYSVPLDVLVVDMDWHITSLPEWKGMKTDQAGEDPGWTGYTWEKRYFPDPGEFISWVHQKDIKITLNLHPASGIQPHEAQYSAMAQAMDVDPSSKQYIPFDITDKKFTKAYFDNVIHPLERLGIDFWWLDWQQWSSTKIPGVTPTFWLNYVFFTDMEREGLNRPLLYHRWGGLGNHRYQIGFSGDVISVWESLKFQPYFTMTASNVGFGYWSHDLGGHMPGVISPELYTRWIQWGVFSPIVRTHVTRNPRAERRIWEYPAENFQIMREALRTRYEMIPYIYSNAFVAHQSGISLLRPLYYEFPESPESYNERGEFYFGDDMIIAPVTDSASPVTRLGMKHIWLPEGEWVEWQSGEHVRGPIHLDRTVSIDETPAYIKCGSIIPSQSSMHASDPPETALTLQVYPGPSHKFVLYEDDGRSDCYLYGVRAQTVMTQDFRDGVVTLKVNPVEGAYPRIPNTRTYTVWVRDVLPPASVRWNGQLMAKKIGEYASEDLRPGEFAYDATTASIVIVCPETDRSSSSILEVKIDGHDGNYLASGVRGFFRRVKKSKEVFERELAAPIEFAGLAQTGERINMNPEDAYRSFLELGEKQKLLLQELSQILKPPSTIGTSMELLKTAPEIRLIGN